MIIAGDLESLTFADALGKAVGLGWTTLDHAAEIIRLTPPPPEAVWRGLRDGWKMPNIPTLANPDPWPAEVVFWGYGDMQRRLADSSRYWECEVMRQEEAAMKAVSPLLAKGMPRCAVMAAMRVRAPALSDRTLEEIADEEAAWWLRWRHERNAA